MYDSLNSKDHTINIFIDYKKAFDTVNHSILIRKLEKYGVRGLPLNLIKNYLCDRYQTVKVNKCFSAPKRVTIGIPQGSILGPLLFLIYINDLPNVSDRFQATLFADDTTLIFKGHDYNILIDLCNTELEKFKQWSESNRLSINPEKTNCLLVTNRKISQIQNNVVLDGKLMSFVPQHKFLGVSLDNKLKFDKHIEIIRNKISKSIGIMFKIQKLVPQSCLKTLYYSFIYPYLLYCLPIWGGTYHTHLNSLITLQKRAVRIISNASYLDHTDPLFKSNQILKLGDIYIFTLAIYMFRNSDSFSNFSRSHSHDTRNRNILLPPYERLTTTQQSVLYGGTRVWNDLPDNINTSPTISISKYRLKLSLLNNYG